MLSEEEKEAIKLLEDIKNNSWTTKYIMSSDSKNADILLNLITKQQNRIEKLKHSIEIILSELPEDMDYKAIEKLLED